MSGRAIKPSTVLKKARKLIERGWTRGDYARTRTGAVCNWRSKDAVRFCWLGALRRAEGYEGPEDDLEAYRFMKLACGETWPHRWNDRQTNKRPVLRAFDRAIKLAESEGK